MTLAADAWSEERVGLFGGQVHLLKGGQGDPLVVLPRDNGYPGWQPFHSITMRPSSSRTRPTGESDE